MYHQKNLNNHRGLSVAKSLGIVLLLGLCPYSALAQDYVAQQTTHPYMVKSQSLTFAQVLQKVQQYQAGLGVWQVQQNVADAHLQQSRLWQNPSFSIQQTGFESDQDRELEISVSQKLDIFGERKAAQQLARVQRQQVDLNQALYDAQLKLAVKYLWSQMAILELENQIAQQQLDNSQAILDATRLRYRAGSIAQVDQDRTLMTHIENQRTAQEIGLNLQIAKKRLANLWGETQANFALGNNSDSAWPVNTQTDVAAYLQQNLIQRSIQLKAQQQRSKMDYLKAKARPNPTLNVGMVNNKSADTRQTEQQFRVGLDIPLNIFDRQQYALRIAQAQQDFLTQQQQFYRQQQLNSMQTLKSEMQGLKQQYDLMNDQQIPLSEDLQRKMLLGFKAGKFAITDVQQASIQLQEQRLKKMQLLKSAWQKAIETESLVLGISPEQVTSNDALHQINQTLWQDTYNLNSSSGAE
ncbi:TolC family protein [Acinetobacter ihumii]|uniref:TolC family protein n=1 Tax=Acinetobacter ihumii TaxID=2483802 RepID=UPI00102FA05F|nr:TolC family protein [Acinetobacter ihumii]